MIDFDSHPNKSRRYKRSSRPYGSIKGLKAICHPDEPMRNSNGLCNSCDKKRRLYGADFVALYKEQGGHCKMCQDSFEEYDMQVDHNHRTLKVRGLVCRTCNVIIGFAEHERLPLALAYIESND
jgi:Recombination endonuclease VII